MVAISKQSATTTQGKKLMKENRKKINEKVHNLYTITYQLPPWTQASRKKTRSSEMNQSTKRAWSGRKRERALRPGTRIHLGRGGQSANSVKLYKISSWEPGKKHQSTCRAS